MIVVVSEVQPFVVPTNWYVPASDNCELLMMNEELVDTCIPSLNHLYVSAPFPVNVVLSPSQRVVLLALILTTGLGLTVICIESVRSQPLVVPVTVKYLVVVGLTVLFGFVLKSSQT